MGDSLGNIAWTAHGCYDNPHMRLIVVYILRVQQYKIVTIMCYDTACVCNGKR